MRIAATALVALFAFVVSVLAIEIPACAVSQSLHIPPVPFISYVDAVSDSPADKRHRVNASPGRLKRPAALEWTHNASVRR